MCIAEVWIAFLMARRCLGLGFVFSEYGVSWNILNSMRLLEQDDFNRPDKWDRSIQNDVRCRWDFWIETVCTIFSGKFRKFIGPVQVSQPLCTHFFHKSCLEGWACSSGADQSKKKTSKWNLKRYYFCLLFKFQTAEHGCFRLAVALGSCPGGNIESQGGTAAYDSEGAGAFRFSIAWSETMWLECAARQGCLTCHAMRRCRTHPDTGSVFI